MSKWTILAHSLKVCQQFAIMTHRLFCQKRDISEQAVDQIPDQEPGELADQQQYYCPERPGLVEAECYGHHITDDRYPAGKGQPDSVLVDIVFLFP